MTTMYQALCQVLDKCHLIFKPYSEVGGIMPILHAGRLRIKEGVESRALSWQNCEKGYNFLICASVSDPIV